MHSNDARSYLEAVEKGQMLRRIGRAEHLSQIWHRIQQVRYREPPPDYASSVEELRLLDRAVRGNGGRLAVVVFRLGREPEWDELVSAVSDGLRGTGVPFLDLGPALLAADDETDLWVHPSDAHPNEIAHRIAAEEIARLLEDEGLLAPE
jgi:hypothetical protein